MKKLLTFGVAVLLAAGAFAQDRTIEATASIVPASPTTGENRLEVDITEGGKPVAGLKLASGVGMTNMDMGTAHPPVVEAKPGRYVVHPMLLMSGPWRVTLASDNPKFSVNFDMTAGAKQPWRPAKQTITLKGAAKTAPARGEPVMPTVPKGPEPAPSVQHGIMTHAAASLPQLKEASSYTWSEAMDFDTRTGFGKLYPMVRMMMLMMVGGSGMEGMKMAPMEMTFDPTNFVEAGAEPGDGPLKVAALLAKPAVGDNNVMLTITTSDGKPVEKAKVTASVAMIGMDMGTTHPAVEELGKGRYRLRANFSMMGPWRLTLTIMAPGTAASNYHFDFDAKSPN